MNNRNLGTFVDAIVSDERPPGFAATSAEEEVIRLAITLTACRPRSGEPDGHFVEELRRELADQNARDGIKVHTDAIRPLPGIVEEASRSHQPSSRTTRLARRRVPFLAAAAAGVALAVGSALTVTVLEPVPHHGVATQGASAPVLHSSELLAGDGGVIGRAYAYGGNPSWVFMSVRASALSGTYDCKLLLGNGTTLGVGAVVVHDGTGDFAHPARVGASKIRAAVLVTAAGSVVARASFS